MPGENIFDWSVTAINNGAADTSIGWAEGQTRASVNNSARSMMAALAKNRNLTTGVITTGGTPNAQTFTSGVGYNIPGIIPTGLRVLLRIGVATNSAAATLSMDGLGPHYIKTETGALLVGGELIGLGHAELLFDSSYWILLGSSQTSARVAPTHGRFSYTGVSSCQFVPFGGNQIKIAGVLYTIPASGVTGLNNFGCFVSGSIASLAPDTFYYVYVFSNSGIITGAFWPIANVHAPSNTAGNEGVETMVGNENYTLIGAVRTDASAQFSSNLANRNVISWNNRRPLSASGGSTSGAGTVSTSYAELSTSYRASFCKWAEDDIMVGLSGFGFSTDTGASMVTAGVGIDGAVTVRAKGNATVTQANYLANLGGMEPDSQMAEGYHYITPVGATDVGTASFHVIASALLRG